MKTTFTLLIGFLMIGLLGFSQPNGMGQAPMQHPKMGQGHFNKIPNLTDQQKEQMKALHTAFLKTTNPLKNQLAEKRAHLRTITAVDKPNQKEIDNTIDEIGQLRTQMLKARTDMQLKVRALLTEEQKIHFDAMKASSHGKSKKMNQHRPPMEHRHMHIDDDD